MGNEILFTADEARKNLDNVYPVLSDICRLIKHMSKEGSCQAIWLIEKASNKFYMQLLSCLVNLGYIVDTVTHEERGYTDIELIIKW